MIKNKFQKSNTNSKYNNVKRIIDDITFDSMAEADFYLLIKRLEKIGKMKLIEVHPTVHMTAARILYKPDFLIEENGRKIYVDVKGYVTPEFALKLRLWKHYGAGILRVLQKNKFEFDKIDEVETINSDSIK